MKGAIKIYNKVVSYKKNIGFKSDTEQNIK